MSSSVKLLTCSENVCIWDLWNSTPLYKFGDSTVKSFATVAWNTNDEFVCVPCEKQKIIICDLVQNDITKMEFDVGVDVSAVSFSSDSSCIAVGSKTGEVLCWNCKQERIIKSISELSSGVTCLQYSLTDSHIAVGCVNGEIQMFNTSSGFSTKPLRLDNTPLAVRSLHFHPKNKFLLGSCFEGGQAVLWDVKKSTIYLSVPEKHKAPAMDLKFSPLGNHVVASVGLDKRIFIHDIRQKRLVNNIRCDVPLRTMEFSPDGILVIAGGSKGLVYIYDLRTSALVNSITAHSKPVQKVSLSGPGGQKCKKKQDIKHHKVLSSMCSTEFDMHSNQLGSSSSNENVYLPSSVSSPVQAIASVDSGGVSCLDGDVFSPPQVNLDCDDKENIYFQGHCTIRNVKTEEEERHFAMKTKENEPSGTPVIPALSEKSQGNLQGEDKSGFVTDTLSDFRQSMHKDISYMCFQMLKQFTILQIQVQELQEKCETNKDLLEEVKHLREENKRLRSTY